ncbi:hypothetical protein FPSE_07231 [Fusarium pseudograminearum CS3096]|uniref:Uncharacterized protein n=1 Tax=Fusarium pseudograminearum (strain CS3096) TaxID=1028729 RepID=K3VF66_FUSPC|nr:hypothetical protein FPSE_07231 [Fusarium pseudograminearum CS3096]EKJ72594.1 hypothetical protein FPSE_07231 [Fusarium pseudograminearum CS3096]
MVSSFDNLLQGLPTATVCVRLPTILENAKTCIASLQLFTTKNINSTLVAFSQLQSANYTTPFGASRRLH